MILHQRPLRTIYDTLSLTNSTLLTADTILWCTKNSYSQLMIFVSFSVEKIIACSPLSHLTSCTPTKSNLCLANSLAAVSEPALYMLLTFQVPNLMSLFRCVVLTKVSVQVQGKCSCFIMKPVFMVRSC